MRDAWRLAVGTLSAVPVAPPATVTRRTTGAAMLLAPVAVLPLAVLVALVVAAGGWAGVPPLGTGLLAVGVLALGTRAFHWDGLSDVADGLTASYDRERSLQVMKTGTSGPAGTLAVVLVAGAQATGLAAHTGSWWHALLAGGLVCLSRCALWITCARPVPYARFDGLGAEYSGTLPVPVAAVGVVLTAVVPGLLVIGLVRRCVRRLGGVTGDVFGAAIELTLAALLLGSACLL
jgi:adenosylcobinamide-GDP ribazoletransferase